MQNFDQRTLLKTLMEQQAQKQYGQRQEDMAAVQQSVGTMGQPPLSPAIPQQPPLEAPAPAGGLGAPLNAPAAPASPEPINAPPPPPQMPGMDVPQRPRDFLDAIGIPAQNREQALEAVMNISEGLGNVRVTTPGHIMFNSPVNEPTGAETTRRALDKEMDYLKPQEAQFYNRALRTNMFHEGLQKSVLEKLLPGMFGQQRADTAADIAAWNAERSQGNFEASLGQRKSSQESLDAYRVKMDEDRDKGIEIRETGENRRQRDQDFRQYMQGRELELKEKEKAITRVKTILSTQLKDASRKSLSNITRSATALDRINLIVAAVREKDTLALGPIWSRMQDFAAKIGIQDPEYATLQQELTDTLGVYLSSKTGAQRGMEEVAWLAQTFPQAFQNAETFDALLKNLRSMVSVDADNMYGVYKDLPLARGLLHNTLIDLGTPLGKKLGSEYGKLDLDSMIDPTQEVFKRTGAPPEGAVETSAEGGTIKVMLNGKEGEIPAKQWGAFLKKYPNATKVSN